MDDHNHIHIHMLLTSVLTVCWLLLITLPQSRSQPSSYDYSVCKELSYNCGNLSNISYPFWGQNQSPQCGGGDPFQLSCHDDNTTSIRIGSQNFTVKEINITAQTMRMVRADLALNVCSPQFEDTYLNSTLFRYASSVYIITIFYNCDSISDVDRPRVGVFQCEHGAVAFYDVLGAYDESHKACEKHVQVPVDQHVPYDINGGRDFLDQVFSRGFLVNYTVLDTIHYRA